MMRQLTTGMRESVITNRKTRRSYRDEEAESFLLILVLIVRHMVQRRYALKVMVDD